MKRSRSLAVPFLWEEPGNLFARSGLIRWRCRHEADVAPSFVCFGRDLLLRGLCVCRDREADLKVDCATFRNAAGARLDLLPSSLSVSCLVFASGNLLEPIKFVAAYLAATGNFLYAITTFIVGELLKLVMIERLFELTRKKLLRIPACIRIWILRAGANLDHADRSGANAHAVHTAVANATEV